MFMRAGPYGQPFPNPGPGHCQAAHRRDTAARGAEAAAAARGRGEARLRGRDLGRKGAATVDDIDPA